MATSGYLIYGHNCIERENIITQYTLPNGFFKATELRFYMLGEYDRASITPIVDESH